MSESRTESPKWPLRLQELCRELHLPLDDSRREKARAEAWVLLSTSIARYLRIHMTRLGRISSEELEDITSAKSLDLLGRAELGEWKISGRAPSEITGFLSAVARNGLVDMLRESGRRVEPPSEGGRAEWDVGGVGDGGVTGVSQSPEARVEQREFSAALRQCADRLAPRSRLIWFFRVFLEMTTKEIAAHPEVALKPGHVDVVLQRAREAVRDCMRARGFEPEDMPPGAFVELWRSFRLRAN